MKLRKILISILTLATLLPTLATADLPLNEQRKVYQQAKKALQTQQLPQYQSLRNQLNGYPLQSYLDYLFIDKRLSQTSNDSVAAFLEKHQNSFFANRLRASYLNKLASNQQWQTYLNFYQPTQSATRQCYQAQALMHTGQTQAAEEAALALWLVPYSQDKACDPVFNFIEKRGLLTDERRWERLMLSLRAGQFSLAKYLARQVNATATAQAWTERWQQIHSNPQSLLSQLPAQVDHNRVSLANDVPLSREIIIHGLHRLARQDPDKAYGHWQRLKSAYEFSDEQRASVQREMGLWAALNRKDEALRYFGDTQNEPWRVRAALWQQDWKAVKLAIASLDENTRHETAWQYWLARSLEKTGDPKAAESIYRGLVKERDYYAFLAADRLGADYSMNPKPIEATAEELAKLKSMPAYQRLYEFYHIGEDLEARREAYYLQSTLSNRELQLLSLQTHEWGWHNQTIAILGSAKYWDALDQRFPVLYQDAMQKAASAQKLDIAWLLAIARQESAFNSQAHSHAGAMGLMQVMPATGRATAKLLNKPLNSVSELYDPNRNIEIGSRYLRKVYDDLQQNPVLATAAYNAGPHRVMNWLPKDSALPADIWAENIPYNETRGYIRAVMSYKATFDHQLKRPVIPLSERMPTVRPAAP
ncbi:transglycosylase SLT domain-containing protein [Methylophaga sp. OBS3]|uniref:transglycosylase SLT domain-containing protein n=1 Tax=Methylophaga sp. OBS3 TaxID=2991934 RepID=UPI00225BC6D1|nr:transglycosylase SLT domain-containing protein [Methylophaga sp. OBS3]MCX4189936.1 transglycosylase SLT domain-containing protein [Methylophaga sp. OBS3]